MTASLTYFQLLVLVCFRNYHVVPLPLNPLPPREWGLLVDNVNGGGERNNNWVSNRAKDCNRAKDNNWKRNNRDNTWDKDSNVSLEAGPATTKKFKLELLVLQHKRSSLVTICQRPQIYVCLTTNIQNKTCPLNIFLINLWSNIKRTRDL